jgi:CheY-like chemotaxis protein
MLIMVVDDEVDMIDLFKQRFKKEIKEGAMEFVFHTSAEKALQDLKKKIIPI